MKLSDYFLTSCLLPFAIQTGNTESYDDITKDPCGNAFNISDVRRNSNYTTLITDVDLCDDDLDFSKWYTFGNKLTSHCVENNKCGTASGIWIDGLHPTGEEIQQVYACSGDSKENCCAWKEVAYIKKCRNSFVYKLGRVFQCPMAYCVGDSIEDVHRGKESSSKLL